MAAVLQRTFPHEHTHTHTHTHLRKTHAWLSLTPAEQMKDEILSLSLGGSGGEAVSPCQQAWPPYIWNHITPNKSVCNAQFLLKSIRKEKTSPAAKFKSAFSGWRRARCVFTPLCIITNHIRFCWAYECNDQSEAFRWVIAETLLFRHRTHWLTEFSH